MIQKVKDMQGQESEEYIKIFDKFENEGNELVDKGVNATSSAANKGYITQLEFIHKYYSDEMRNTQEHHMNSADKTIEKIKTSNILYLKSAR